MAFTPDIDSYLWVGIYPKDNMVSFIFRGSRKQEAGSRKQAAGSRKQEAGSRQQAAGSRHVNIYRRFLLMVF